MKPNDGFLVTYKLDILWPSHRREEYSANTRVWN